MEISVRKADTGDIEAMTALLSNLFSIEKDFTPDLEKQVKGLAMMISGGEERVAMVAQCQGEVVGMVTGQMLTSTAEGGLVTLVEDLVVSPQLRGSGVGANLLAEIESWARPLGSTRLQLLADSDNGPAKKFYENSGWAKTNLICLRKTKPGTKLCPGMREKR